MSKLTQSHLADVEKALDKMHTHLTGGKKGKDKPAPKGKGLLETAVAKISKEVGATEETAVRPARSGHFFSSTYLPMNYHKGTLEQWKRACVNRGLVVRLVTQPPRTEVYVAHKKGKPDDIKAYFNVFLNAGHI